MPHRWSHSIDMSSGASRFWGQREEKRQPERQSERAARDLGFAACGSNRTDNQTRSRFRTFDNLSKRHHRPPRLIGCEYIAHMAAIDGKNRTILMPGFHKIVRRGARDL